MVPILTDTNVVLRPPRDGDVDARFRLGRAPEILEMYGIRVDATAEYTRDMASAWVRSIAEHPHAWIIETHGALIGSIRLDAIDTNDRRASLAVGMVDAKLLGKGLGTKAMRLVLAHAFSTLDLHRISVRVLAYNHRAIRAYEKCGFVVEGRERETAFVDGAWHDDIIMGLLESEFANSTGNGGMISSR